MTTKQKPVTLLMADDDPDDRLLLEDAILEAGLIHNFCFVEDGEELMDYLHRRGKYSNPADAPEPGLILLDLNMPRKDGREVIMELKSHVHLCKIPVVILTTSQANEDIQETYRLGANSFITKPITFEQLVTIIKHIDNYWFNIVTLPVS